MPEHLSRFSSCLAVEAAGQLAAWIAMAELDFALRPVAGVAADLHFGADVRPGQTLELAIEIDSCDRQAVNYSAHAYVDGATVIQLERSAGPMLPMETFDAPDAMRRRYELLCGPGAPGGEFPGVPEHELEIIEEVHAKSARAALKVPLEAAFFSDHFPRRPVFPGTMLLDAHIQLALSAAEHAGYWPPGARLKAKRAPNLKLRAFIAPGDIVELRVGLAPPDDDGVMMVQTSAYMDKKQLAMGSLEIAETEGER